VGFSKDKLKLISQPHEKEKKKKAKHPGWRVVLTAVSNYMRIYTVKQTL